MGRRGYGYRSPTSCSIRNLLYTLPSAMWLPLQLLLKRQDFLVNVLVCNILVGVSYVIVPTIDNHSTQGR